MCEPVIRQIVTDRAPLAAGPYSQAIVAGDVVYTAGMIPVDPETGRILEAIEDQAKQVLDNVCAVLEAAGTDGRHIVRTTIYLTDMGTFSAVNGVYAMYFSPPYPARSCIEVSNLPKCVRIMIDATAVIPGER